MRFLSFTKLLLIALTSGVLYTCQFESDEVYEDYSKKEASPPELSVLELSIDQDTIFLSEAIIVRFSFDAGANTIYQVRVLIDGREYLTFDSPKGEFQLNPSEFTLSYHSLNLNVVTNSNSGSIADVLGVEGYEFVSNEWSFFSLNRLNMPLPYSASFNDLGELYLHWDSCKYQEIEYTVDKHLKTDLGPRMQSTRTSHSAYLDRYFFGGESYYQVYISEKGKTKLYPWGHFTIEEDFPKPEFGLVQNRYALTWERKNYSGNLSAYQIIDLNSGAELGSFSGLDTFAYIDQHKLGQNHRFSILPVPKRASDFFNNNLDIYTRQFECTIGTKIIPMGMNHTSPTVLSAENRILYNDFLNVKAYDVRSNSVVDVLYETRTDPNSLYNEIYLGNSRDLFCIYEKNAGLIHYGTTDDLGHHETFQISTPRQTPMQVVDGYNLVILKDKGIWYYFDMSRKILVDSLYISHDGLDSWMAYPEFSTDGNYHTYYTKWGSMKVLRFDGRNFTFLYEQEIPLTGHIDRIFLDSEDPGVLLHYDYKKVYFRNIEDFSLIKSYDFTTNADLAIQQVDFRTRRFLTADRRDTSLAVHKLDDGALIYRCRAQSLAENILSENTIINTHGYRLDFTDDD